MSGPILEPVNYIADFETSREELDRTEQLKRRRMQSLLTSIEDMEKQQQQLRKDLEIISSEEFQRPLRRRLIRQSLTLQNELRKQQQITKDLKKMKSEEFQRLVRSEVKKALNDVINSRLTKDGELERLVTYLQTGMSKIDYLDSIILNPITGGISIAFIHTIEDRVKALTEITKFFATLEEDFPDTNFEPSLFHTSDIDIRKMQGRRVIPTHKE